MNKLWGRMISCAPVVNRRPARLLAEVSRRVTNPPQVDNLPHNRVSASKPRPRRSGQALTEFAVLYAGVILPLTFMTIFVAEMLWIWHSVADFTRDGARYAATHCWQSDGANVLGYMTSHVPAMIDQAQFQNNDAGISIQYFSDGGITAFSGDACAGLCVPQTVSVSITNYQFLRFAAFMKLPPVTIPPFTTTVPMESAGFQDASGTCVP